MKWSDHCLIAMPLLVTQRDRSFIAAGDYQKLYGTFLHNQYLLDMSKCRDLYTNGRNDDAEKEESRNEGNLQFFWIQGTEA